MKVPSSDLMGVGLKMMPMSFLLVTKIRAATWLSSMLAKLLAVHASQLDLTVDAGLDFE